MSDDIKKSCAANPQKYFNRDNQITDLTPLKDLTQLTDLDLQNNPDLTKAQIAELQKALPNCIIFSNPTK